MRRVWGLVVVVLGACSAASSAPTLPAGQARVVRVVDGDTIVVDLGGGDETVRLIGVDTPETKKPNHPIECFGEEASHRTTALLPPGTIVRLERDKEARDRYGRLLAYVFRESDGMFVEDELLREGLADTLVIAPNTAHEADLATTVAAARRAGTGLWAACGGNHVVPGG